MCRPRNEPCRDCNTHHYGRPASACASFPEYQSHLYACIDRTRGVALCRQDDRTVLLGFRNASCTSGNNDAPLPRPSGRAIHREHRIRDDKAYRE